MSNAKLNQVVLVLGSNIDPKIHIPAARKAIRQSFYILRESSFLKNKAEGPLKQPDFVNGAILLETKLTKSGLRNALKKIEKALGRQKALIKEGPRTIDIDIVIWNKRIVDPDFHKRAYLRKFVFQVCPELSKKFACIDKNCL